MVENLSSFLDWLRLLMHQKGIIPADIARTGYVTDSAVSLLFSMKTKSVSHNMCRAIAQAADIPLSEVYSQAGLYPLISQHEQRINAILEKYARLSPEGKAQYEKYLDFLIQEQEEEERMKTSALKKARSAGG